MPGPRVERLALFRTLSRFAVSVSRCFLRFLRSGRGAARCPRGRARGIEGTSLLSCLTRRFDSGDSVPQELGQVSGRGGESLRFASVLVRLIHYRPGVGGW